MSVLLAFPTPADFAQHAALAFHERQALSAFVTTYAYRPDGPTGRMVRQLPPSLRRRVEPQLSRRRVPLLPPDRVQTVAFWEAVRTLADKAGANAKQVDAIWHKMAINFTKETGRLAERSDVTALYAYEFTALEAFQAAERRGIVKILDFPSLNSRQFETLQRAEKAKTPELRGPHDGYFEALFEERQARRDAEMRAADVIITNSTVTRASHIEGGADPEKTYAVPYGAPPPIDKVRVRPDPSAPLTVVWAGTFNVRKGAQHFLSAWQRFVSGGTPARAEVFGRMALPSSMVSSVPGSMTFHGSVPRHQLFEAMERADVLMFPTLSDGFGMVVTEAFAHALPVITTAAAGASDLMKPGETGLVIEAGDPGAIVDALVWCADNRIALSGMRESALAAARGWQWSDYRQALVAAVVKGSGKAGYDLPLKANVMDGDH